ncbi:MAG TPA: ABC transporter substrate-binding protein [Xanthobacteraceae bacterium]|nr:ABC transporter substrate-binding protein [Xanthobacteraceae bacterium]
MLRGQTSVRWMTRAINAARQFAYRDALPWVRQPTIPLDAASKVDSLIDCADPHGIRILSPKIELYVRNAQTHSEGQIAQIAASIVEVPAQLRHSAVHGFAAGLDVRIVRGQGSVDAIRQVGAGNAVFGFADTGSLVLARANDGIPVKLTAIVYAAFHYTFPALVTSERAIARDRNRIAGGLRAVVAAQAALKSDVSLAERVGQALFPPAEAALLMDVIARDLPFYTPHIPEAAVAGLNDFAHACGLLDRPVPYEGVVATEFSHLWRPQA